MSFSQQVITKTTPVGFRISIWNEALFPTGQVVAPSLAPRGLRFGRRALQFSVSQCFRPLGEFFEIGVWKRFLASYFPNRCAK